MAIVKSSPSAGLLVGFGSLGFGVWLGNRAVSTFPCTHKH